MTIEEHSTSRGAAPSSSKSRLDSPPYLSLNIPQALSLPDPEAPERRTYSSVLDLFDHRAAHSDASKIAAGFTRLKDGSQDEWECSTLTYSQLPRIAKTIAAKLKPAFELAATVIQPADPGLPPLQPTPTIGILCPSGLDFFVHTLAVWYSGFALLPIAIGTTKEGIQNLLQRTGACALLAHPSQWDVANEALELFEQQNTTRPHHIETVAEDAVEPIISQQTATGAFTPLKPLSENSVLIIFHSSGSTGLPKPIYHIHRFWAFSTLTARGTEFDAYTTTPLYHGGMSDFLRALQAGAGIFFHPITGASNTLSPEHLMAGYRSCAEVSAGIKYFLSVPFILEMVSKSQHGLDWLSSMHLVSTGGAPLPGPIGDLLVAKGVPLVSRLGSSECGFLMSSFRDFASDKEWSWLRIEDPVTQKLLDFHEDKDNEGLYELIVTGAWPTKLLSNGPRNIFSTEDLYSRHADHTNWYKYATRVDDTLVLINGKKFAAGLIESRLRQSRPVQDAIVFGSNRALVGAIIIPDLRELKHTASAEEKHTFLERLQPDLAQLNKTLPSHAQLDPALMFVADDALADSIPRSSKGTLQRGHAYRQLSPLFDRIYSAFEDGTIDGYPAKEELAGAELRDHLCRVVGRVLCHDGSSIDPKQDFYDAGMNSLSAVRIKAGIHQTLSLGVNGGADKKLETKAIYDHPSVEDLASYIEFTGEKTNEGGGGQSALQDQMTTMVATHASCLGRHQARPPAVPRGSNRVAVLTGATGALGSHLLVQLLRDDTIDSVICLVRASSDDKAIDRIREGLENRKLGAEVAKKADHVVCVAADLSMDNFGLSADSPFWSRVSQASSIVVIHAAWTVNFALSLKSFEAGNIKGLYQLLNFSLSEGAEGFLFCSSVASVLGNEASQVHEELSRDPSTAGTIGYSQSKWVAEAICSAAASKGLPMAVARIGQLCSDKTHGIWNETEAWPLLLRTAEEVGKLPRIEQTLDWLPVDVAARSLLEIVKGRESNSGSAHFYHVLLPLDSESVASQTPAWEDLLAWLSSSGELTFEVVSHAEWLSAVRAASTSIRGRALIEDIWKNLKPADTNSNMNRESSTRISTLKARAASPSLTEAGIVMDEALLKQTIEHWKQTRFL